MDSEGAIICVPNIGSEFPSGFKSKLNSLRLRVKPHFGTPSSRPHCSGESKIDMGPSVQVHTHGGGVCLLLVYSFKMISDFYSI